VSDPADVYTVEDANALLPELRDRLARVRDSRQRLLGAARRIRDAVATDGGGVAGSDWFDAQRELREQVVWLADRSIALRDPETGLIDFPGQREGEAVWLCWRLGEDRVAWWHPLDTGFLGRRPL
jgi:hypothetical protein